MRAAFAPSGQNACASQRSRPAARLQNWPASVRTQSPGRGAIPGAHQRGLRAAPNAARDVTSGAPCAPGSAAKQRITNRRFITRVVKRAGRSVCGPAPRETTMRLPVTLNPLYLFSKPCNSASVINERGNFIQALATAPETCFPEQDSPGLRAVTQHIRRLRRASGATAERCKTAAQSPSPRFTTRLGSLQQFGNCCRTSSRNRKRLWQRWPRELGDPTLRQITGNSFYFPVRSGVSPGCYRPSTSRPLGLAACQREPWPNALLVETSAQTEGFVPGKIRRRWLRPVVSSDRRLAVEIPAARSSCEGQGFRAAEIAGRRGALSSSEGNVIESPPPGHFGQLVFDLESEFAKMPEGQVRRERCP